MSIPVESRQEISVTSIGDEINPQNVIAKDTMWTVAYSAGYLIVKEFEGQLYRLHRNLASKKFIATQAKNPADGSIYSDRFWLWVLKSDKTITLYEIEPFVDQDPAIISAYSFGDGVDSFDFSVTSGLWSSARGMLLKSGELYLTIIKDPMGSAGPTLFYSEQIDWSPSHINNKVGSFCQGSNIAYSLYLDVASPPNEGIDEYEFLPPDQLDLSENTPFSNIIDLSWPAVTGATSYVIEVDDNPGFTSPTVLYEGSGLSTTDIVLYMGIHYYRIAARRDVGLQSDWFYNQIETFDNHATMGSTEVVTEEEYFGNTSENNIAVLSAVAPVRVMKLQGGNSVYRPEIHIQSFIERKITIEWGKEIF